MSLQNNEVVIDGVVIAARLAHPELTAHVCTACDMLDVAKVAALERALDDSPIADVKKIDRRDPPRAPASQFSGVLTGFVQDRKRSSYAWMQSSSGGRLRFEAQVDLQHRGRVGPPGKRDAGYSSISFSLARKSLSAEDVLEFRKLFMSVCCAVEAFYGRAAEYSLMYFQREVFMANAVPHPLLRKTVPDFDREIWDVYWLNYFGPGYVKFWGQEKVKALGQGYDVTCLDNDAICVQTTPEPVFADPKAKGIRDYPWKQHFYEVLGENTFMHETHKQGEPGQYVPTLEDHRRFLKRLQPA